MPASKISRKLDLESGVSCYGLVLAGNSAVLAGIFAYLARLQPDWFNCIT